MLPVISNKVLAMRKYQYKNRRALQTISSMASSTGLIVEGAVFRSLQEQGFHLDPEVDNKSQYEPQMMFDCLERYYVPRGKARIDYDPLAWSQAFDLTLRAFNPRGDRLKPLFEDTEFLRALKHEKSSGAPEFRKKGDVFSRELVRAQAFLCGVGAPQPCVAYHRVQHGDKGPKTRLVWGYPESITIAEAKYARPLINHFKLNKQTPMAFGMKRFETAARMIPIENMGLRYGLDFSGFDSSIAPVLIDMAFRVLRTFFPAGRDIDAEWSRIVNYFIHTPILMPDGYVYQKHRGVPSGSYFTQLVDSIVNYFAIQYAVISLVGMSIDDGKILVLGDDSLFGLPKWLSLEDLAAKLSTLGLKVHDGVKSGLWKDGEFVHFLGHIWERGIVNRAPLDVAKRMAFPERPSRVDDPRERIVSRVLPYVSDAYCAHDIIRRWSRYKGAYVPGTYAGRKLAASTGWLDFQQADSDEVNPNLNDAEYLAYVGLYL